MLQIHVCLAASKIEARLLLLRFPKSAVHNSSLELTIYLTVIAMTAEEVLYPHYLWDRALDFQLTFRYFVPTKSAIHTSRPW